MFLFILEHKTDDMRNQGLFSICLSFKNTGPEEIKLFSVVAPLFHIANQCVHLMWDNCGNAEVKVWF